MLRRSERICKKKRFNAGGGEEEEAKTRIVQNPLENPVVLNHLFGLCPSKVIATCRLVCKQWYNESLVAWRTNSSLTITVTNNDIVVVNFRKTGEPNITLKTLLEYVENPENKCSTKPYRRLQLWWCQFSSRSKLQQFELIWKALGPNLTTLILYNCSFYNVEEFRKIVYTCFPNLQCLELLYSTFPLQSSLNEEGRAMKYRAPLYGEHKHLKSVKLNIDIPSEIEDETGTLPSWLEFFSHFPSLTSFEIDGPNYLNLSLVSTEFLKILEAIGAVRSNNADKLPFKTFSTRPAFCISRDFGEKTLELAQQLRLPLDTLSIVAHPELKLNFLKSTLNFYAPTVKNIHAFLEKDGNGLTTPTTLMREFPFGFQLHCLEYFEIQYNLCENFTFLKYMPNLKRLNVVEEMMDLNGPDQNMLTCVAVSNTPKDEMADVTMLRLTKLRVNCVVSADDVKSLIQWMPNVEELTMVIDDETFRIICCGKWKRLKRLEVLGLGLTDKGFTGRSNPEADCEDQDASVSPNITDLQGLEHIEFWNTYPTEDALFHGFLELPNLQRIRVNIDTIPWGERARRAVKKRKLDVIVGFHEYDTLDSLRRYKDFSIDC